MTTIVFYFLSGFCIKDEATRKTLFREQSENSLYPFPLHRISSNKTTPPAYVGERVFTSIWHLPLRHPAFSVFQHLVSVSQLPVAGTTKLPSACTECQIGKSKKIVILYFFTTFSFNTL